jgi:hypothetical protein
MADSEKKYLRGHKQATATHFYDYKNAGQWKWKHLSGSYTASSSRVVVKVHIDYAKKWIGSGSAITHYRDDR